MSIKNSTYGSPADICTVFNTIQLTADDHTHCYISALKTGKLANTFHKGQAVSFKKITQVVESILKNSSDFCFSDLQVIQTSFSLIKERFATKERSIWKRIFFYLSGGPKQLKKAEEQLQALKQETYTSLLKSQLEAFKNHQACDETNANQALANASIGSYVIWKDFYDPYLIHFRQKMPDEKFRDATLTVDENLAQKIQLLISKEEQFKALADYQVKDERASYKRLQRIAYSAYTIWQDEKHPKIIQFQQKMSNQKTRSKSLVFDETLMEQIGKLTSAEEQLKTIQTHVVSNGVTALAHLTKSPLGQYFVWKDSDDFNLLHFRQKISKYKYVYKLLKLNEMLLEQIDLAFKEGMLLVLQKYMVSNEAEALKKILASPGPLCVVWWNGNKQVKDRDYLEEKLSSPQSAKLLSVGNKLRQKQAVFESGNKEIEGAQEITLEANPWDEYNTLYFWQIKDDSTNQVEALRFDETLIDWISKNEIGQALPQRDSAG